MLSQLRHKLFGTIFVLCTGGSRHTSIKKIYDTGQGPFVKGLVGDIFYLDNEGTFSTGTARFGGDPVSWKNHIGIVEIKGLN